MYTFTSLTSLLVVSIYIRRSYRREEKKSTSLLREVTSLLLPL